MAEFDVCGELVDKLRFVSRELGLTERQHKKALKTLGVRIESKWVHFPEQEPITIAEHWRAIKEYEVTSRDIFKSQEEEANIIREQQHTDFLLALTSGDSPLSRWFNRTEKKG